MHSHSNFSRTLTFAAVTIALIFSTPTAAQSNNAITWSPDLHLKTLDDIPNRLRAPVLEGSKVLRLTNGKSFRLVVNCDGYLKAVRAGFHAANNYENRIAASFVFECSVLRDLQQARPATSRNSYHWSADSLTHLPPVLVPGAREITNAASRAEKHGESWKDFNPAVKITKIDGDSLLAEDADYLYSLQILARSDFNGRGAENLAVYGTAQGKHSTWSHAEYFVLTPTANGKLARVTVGTSPR